MARITDCPGRKHPEERGTEWNEIGSQPFDTAHTAAYAAVLTHLVECPSTPLLSEERGCFAMALALLSLGYPIKVVLFDVLRVNRVRGMPLDPCRLMDVFCTALTHECEIRIGGEVGGSEEQRPS